VARSIVSAAIANCLTVRKTTLADRYVMTGQVFNSHSFNQASQMRAGGRLTN